MNLEELKHNTNSMLTYADDLVKNIEHYVFIKNHLTTGSDFAGYFLVCVLGGTYNGVEEWKIRICGGDDWENEAYFKSKEAAVRQFKKLFVDNPPIYNREFNDELQHYGFF